MQSVDVNKMAQMQEEITKNFDSSEEMEKGQEIIAGAVNQIVDQWFGSFFKGSESNAPGERKGTRLN